MDDQRKDIEQTKHPISIGMLFHWITLSAIAAACARFLLVDEADMPTVGVIAALSLGGAATGLIVGGVVASQRSANRWMSPVLGVLLGVAASPLLLIPVQSYQHIMMISFTGCWILIIFSLLVSRFRDDAKLSRRR